MELRYAVFPLCVIAALTGTRHVHFDLKNGEPTPIHFSQKIFNSLLITIALVTSIISFHGKFLYSCSAQLPVLCLLNMVSQTSLTVGVVMQGILPIFTKNHIVKVMTSIIEADQKLRINCKAHYRVVRLKLIAMICIFHVFAISLFVFDGYVWGKSLGFAVSKYFYCETLMLYKLTIHALQFFSILLLIKDRFNFLNKLLPVAARGQCYIVTQLNSANVADIQVSDTCPRPTGKMQKDQKEQKDRLLQPPTVRELSRVHNTLYESSIALNHFFGFLIVIICFEVLVMLIQTVYSGIVVGTGLQKAIKKNSDRHLGVAVEFCWAFYCMCLLALLTGLCDRTVKAANQSAIIAHKILLEDDLEKDIITELLRFAEQIQTQNMTFTAFGLFNVNLTTFIQIIGAVTSYLIVAFQFDGMGPLMDSDGDANKSAANNLTASSVLGSLVQ